MKQNGDVEQSLCVFQISATNYTDFTNLGRFNSWQKRSTGDFLITLFAWLRALPNNPIYRREKGEWGQANPYYATLMRYSPLLILGAIFLGFCGGAANPSLFADNEDLLAVYCLICIPSILITIVSLYGTLMAPVVTAPLISMERGHGTWDILRVTPQSTRSILLAKLFGGLARLRIWPILLILSLLQGLVMAFSVTIAGETLVLWGVPLGLATFLRPWLESLFAGFAGMVASLWLTSAMTALITAYTAVFLMKIFNSSALWSMLALAFEADHPIIWSISGPMFVYILALFILLGLLWQRAKQLSQD